MSKLIKTDAEYSRWIQELKRRYRQSQIQAATQVNREMLRFYWSLGHDIVSNDAENRYGTGFFKLLSEDLRRELPDSKGFSPQSLYYMRNLYLLYNKGVENFQQAVGNSNDSICQNDNSLLCPEDIIFSVPWGHHCIIIDKFFNAPATAWFYVRKIVEEGWSRNVLKSFIDTNLHLRQGKALTSFSRLLPAPDSDLAQELTKDPYIFDFTEMTEPYKERELKKALMANISRFLLELGSGFAYVGEEYRLKVGHTEQFIDLLFYNIKLHSYCVIEVKTGTFGAGDIGQLGTYMTAVNHILKTENDNPTIGLLIYKDKDSILAKYALESSSQPIGVTEFQLTKFIPDEFKSTLPSIEDIESELK